MTDTTDRYDRRSALRVLGHGVIGSAALAAVVSRTNAAYADEKAEEKALDCTEGEIDTASKNMRKALKYVEKSKKAGQVCSKCLQWVKPEKEGCGGCKLFTGPVNPNGYCLSFAPAKG